MASRRGPIGSAGDALVAGIAVAFSTVTMPQNRDIHLNRPPSVLEPRRAVGARAVLRRQGPWLGLSLILLPLLGCAVPQPRGEGRLTRMVEPTTQRGYWLYLPKDYVAADAAARKARRWPLVVTFHGMKPFDNAHPQAREWEQAADCYGFIVIAPELRAPDLLLEFPVRNVHPYFKSDEEATLAVLDHVFANTQADPANVLSTSWSSGGYLAHYMVNRHPDRFTCLAVRQSNFAAGILDPVLAPRSRYHPIFIINTENDFEVCLTESKEAVAWYERNGYKNYAWIKIKALGHERTPDMAADFFGRVCSLQPSRPLAVLARRQAIDGNAKGLGLLAGVMSDLQKAPPGAPALELPASATPTVMAPPRPAPPSYTPPRSNPDGVTVRKPPSKSDFVGARFTPATPQAQPAAPPPATPTRAADAPQISSSKNAPVGIRVSSAIGIETLLLGFWAECPADWQRSADFLWTLNGDPICDGPNGSKTITTAGEYELGLLVVTPDGQEHRATRVIRVLPPLTASGSGGPSAGANNRSP